MADGDDAFGSAMAIAVSATGVAAPVDDDLGNPGVMLEADDDDDAMLVTADNAFAYQFASYGFSGMPLRLFQFSQGRFVNITSQRPDLIAADAATWMTQFNADPPAFGLGALAAWVADECVLGRSTSAWTTVNQLLAQGRLKGGPGWPMGAGYVAALRTFLDKHQYC